jgi:hypothetical protein
VLARPRRAAAKTERMAMECISEVFCLFSVDRKGEGNCIPVSIRYLGTKERRMRLKGLTCRRSRWLWSEELFQMNRNEEIRLANHVVQ